MMQCENQGREGRDVEEDKSESDKKVEQVRMVTRLSNGNDCKLYIFTAHTKTHNNLNNAYAYVLTKHEHFVIVPSIIGMLYK